MHCFARKVTMDVKAVIFWVAALVVINRTTVGTGIQNDLVYACYPNGTLKIQNPGSYQGVFANNSDTICNTTFMNDKLFLYITDCPFDIAISVTFSNYTGIQSGLLGGRKTVEAFLITCEQIPASGTFALVTNDLGVSYTSTNLSSIYPDYPITSNISEYDWATGTYFPVIEAVIRKALVWRIYIADDNVLLRPELCTAYSGQNISTAIRSKNITELGCSLDSKLLGNFSYDNSVGSGILTADLFAFRFIESEYVTLECEVRICPNTSTHCDITCPGDGRRRRSDSVDYSIDDDSILSRTTTTMMIVFDEATTGRFCSWIIVTFVFLVTQTVKSMETVLFM